MGDEVSVYVEFEFTGTGRPTEDQWRDLLGAIHEQPLGRAIGLFAAATGGQPDRQLTFTSLSPDGKKMLGQVTLIPDATRTTVKDAGIKQALRDRYEAAGGVIPKDPDDLTIRDALLTILDGEAIRRGVTGSAQAKFAQVMQAEARQAAIDDLKYSGTQAGRIEMRVVAMGEQVAASGAAKNYTQENWR